MPQLSKNTAKTVGKAKRATTTASNIKPRRVRWLWKGRLPLGYLTLWTGESSLGKSTLFAWLTSELTRGALDDQPESEVLIVATEDAREDTWVPRLMAAGANLERVHFLDKPDGWNLRDGIEFLELALDQHESEYRGVRLVFIDSIFEETPDPTGGESIYNPAFIRGALRPFNALCKERQIAGLISTHPPKAKGSTFAEVVMASAAFVQVTRVGLLFGWHPDDLELDDQDRRRVLTRPPGGSNIGRDPGSLEFEIQGKFLKIEGEQEEVPRVVEVKPSEVTFRQMTADPKRDKAPTKKAQIRALVDARLADGEWHPSMHDELLTLGFTRAAILEATAYPTKMQAPDKTKWWAKPGVNKSAFRTFWSDSTRPS